MRADIDALDEASSPRDQRGHLLMDREELLLTDKAASNRRLIGDNDRPQAHSAELREGIQRSRQEFKLLPRFDVIQPSTIDHAISVEEHRRSSWAHSSSAARVDSVIACSRTRWQSSTTP